MGGVGGDLFVAGRKRKRKKKEKENFIWGDLSELGRFDPVPPLKKGEEEKKKKNMNREG
jgi:hypothetical protein